MRCLVYVLLLIFLFSSKVSYAKKWYVNDASVVGDIYCTAIGSNANSGLTANLPFLTLTKAVSVASDNDTILVDAGTYKNESIILKKNNLTIIGAGKYLSLFISNTILTAPLFEDVGTYSTCSSICNVIRFNLQHINIKGYKNAGAIVIKADNTVDTTRVFINSCFFEDNYTASPNSVGGGAICATTTGGLSKPSVLTIQNSDFYNNKTNRTLTGGSIFYKNGTRLVMESCNFNYCLSNDILDQPNSGGFIANNKGGPSRISNCVFRGAYLGYISSGSLSPLNQGGAIDNSQTDMVISSCYFHDNISQYGSAIYNFSGNLVIENSLFFDNTCGDGGLPGGTIHNSSGTTVLNHCTISNNKNTSSYSAGNSGIYLYNGSISIKNSIVWGNSLRDVSSYSGGISILNTIVDATGGGYTTGAITSDPLFSNSAGQDFRIKIGSPAIDLGTTSTLSSDLTGFTRISTPDAGAFEYSSPGITIPVCGTFIIPIADPVVGVTVEPTCIVPTGTAVVSSPAEGTGYEYSVDGGTYQVTATFSGLSPGSHTIQVRQIADITQKSALLTFTVAAVPSPPTAGITNNTVVTQLDCKNTAISLTATGGASYSWSDGTTTTLGANLSVTALGTYMVTATAANGCTDTEVLAITKDISVPTAGITNNTGVTQIDCTNPSISLTATGGASYSWSDGTTTTLVANLSVTALGTYIITATAANGCTDTEVLVITKDISVPTAGITNNTGVTQIDCTNPSISLTATGGISYAWSDGTSTVSVLAGLSVSVAGAYTVTATAANGCTDTETITVTKVASTPTAGITNNTGVTQIDCTKPSISLTATGGVSYSWSDGTSLVSVVAGLTVSVAGNYTVTVTAANGCTDTKTITITKDLTPPSDILFTNVTPKFCKSAGKQVSDLTLLASNLTQTITWYDASVNGNSLNVTDLLVSVSYYAEQSEGACKSINRTKVDVTVIDLAAPSIPVNNTQPSCLVATGSVELNMPSAGVWDITATPVVGNPVKVTTNNLTTNPFTYSFAGLDPGSYTFQIKDENGCVSPNSTAVIIDQQPVSPATPILDATEIYCTSKSYTVDQIKFSPAPTGTVKYYDANDLAISGKTVVVANTVYKFSFDNGKCESKVKLATTIPFDEGPTLVPLVDLTTSLICAIDKPTFNTIIANSLLTLPSGYTLLISSDATGNPLLPNTTQIGTLGSATQTVYYNIVNDKGCQSTSFAKLQFKINEGPTDLVLTSTKTYCATDKPTIASLNDAQISGTGVLKWYASETSITPLSGGATLTSGTYFASATLTLGCESVVRKSVDVTIESFGQTILDLANTYAFCKGSIKTIADLSTKPYFSNELVWLNANKVVQTPGTVLIPGTYFAALTKNGCISPNTQEIDVKFTSPIISITPSKLPTCGAGSGVLVISGADASYTYQWSKNDQVMTEKGSQITNLIDDESVKYSVVVTDTKGCIAKDTAMFSGCEPGAIPQIITPDGNGKNDTWIIKYSDLYPEVTVLIFNRWGALVYKSEKPYKDDWGGKSNVGTSIGSDILPTSTYFYQIDKGNGDALESGYLELVK